MLSNLLSNALKFSPRGTVVTIRAGFQAKTSESTTSNGDPKSVAPQQGSLQRIKQALVRTGSLMNLNNNASARSKSNPRMLNASSHGVNGVDGGGRSVGGGHSIWGGPSVHSQPAPKDYVGKQTNGFTLFYEQFNPHPHSLFSLSMLIACHQSSTEGDLIIVVTDSGAGLSKENQAQVFQEGMQFSPECKTGGGSGKHPTHNQPSF